jgi:DNA/RNA endonuclease YhcR with UshA esterase domain
MKKPVLIWLFCAFLVISHAQTATVIITIPANEAAAHVNEWATVEGRIELYKGKPEIRINAAEQLEVK